MSGVSAIVRGFEKVDYTLLHNLASTKTGTYLIVYGGLSLCFLAGTRIIRSTWQLYSGVPWGKYYSTMLALLCGPAHGYTLILNTGAPDDLFKCVMFGWGYSPTLLAVWCLEDLEDGTRPASAVYLFIYSAFCIFLVAYSIVTIVNAGGDGLMTVMILAAVCFTFGLYLFNQDELNKAKILAYIQQQARSSNSDDPVHQEKNTTTASSSAGSSARAYTAAPSSLANDFDVPPQR